MAQINKIQFRRGSNLSNAGTPSAGEPIYDTTTKKLYIGDGTTAAAGATPSLVAISDDKLPLTGGTITGSLGVGASPSFKLDTQDNSTTWASRVLNTNAGGQGLLVRTDATNGATAFGVYANNAYRLTITEALSTFSTNVTVGTKLKLIYGSTSEIKHDDASGSLTLLADQINLKNRAGNETGLTYNSGSGITFTNPSITGNLQLDQGYQLQWGGTNNAIFGHNGSNYVKIKTSGHDRFTIDSSGDASFTGTVRATGVFYANDNGASNPGFRFYNAASGMYHAGSDNLGFAVSGNNVATITSSSATFAGGVAINGASIGSHKLVVDNGTTSLNRGNSSGDIVDMRGLNVSQLKVSTTGSQFRGNIGLNPGWVTTHIAFGSAISGFSATNTGARIEIPLHATSGQAHGSFKFYTNSGDTQNHSLTLEESGQATFLKLTHLKGSAWNSILRIGDTSRSGEQLTHINNGSVNFSIYTSNGTKGVITANHDGSAMTLGADYGSGTLTVTPQTTFSNTVTIGTQQGSKELMTNRARMRHIDGVADANANFSHGDLYVNHISTGNIYMQRATTFASSITVNQLINVSESGGSQAYIYSGGSFTALRTTSNHPIHITANYSSSDKATFGTDGSLTLTGNILHDGTLTTDITSNNTGHVFRANWDTGFTNRIDNNFDGASASASYMRFRIATTPAGSLQTALTLNGAGDVTVGKRLYVTSDLNGAFGTELYNAHSTGHGLKVRGGSSTSQYALFVSNYNQTVTLFQVLGSGDTSIFGNLLIRNTGSSSYIDIDGNTVSGEDGRIYIKGHTSSNSRAFVYFNNGQSSGGTPWYLGALRGSQNFALSTQDDYNTGTNVFAVDANRKIGINTGPSSSYRVKISGNVYSDTTSQFANALIGEVTIGGTNYAMIGSNSSGRGIAFCRDGSASFDDLVIKSNGNVAIGGTGGYQKLSVEGGNIYMSDGYAITWANGNGTIFGDGYNIRFTAWTGSSSLELFRITGSENVMYRTLKFETPGYGVIFKNNGFLRDGNGTYVKFGDWLQGSGGGGIYFPDTNDTDNPEIYPNHNRYTHGSFIFDGRNGIYGGLIFQDIHSDKPTWMFNTSANGGLFYQGAGTWALFYNRGHSTFNINGTSGSGYALYVHGSTYTTGSYGSSDRRLKENIKPLENSLDIVMQMQGVSFTRKEHGLRGEKVVEDNRLGVKEIGFIAQDLSDILPEVVDQNEQTTQYSVNYGQVTALLVEAIKELKQEINDLKGN